ncbi:glutaredoxin family protein [Massilia sp. G4R7]|uniref:Glutaredoxin family protein n=1 Tax=Massilia phyllostachyos TaxID=2898585 RepID=A0ABS8Q9D1_9BURK|nr:glutaredoxin family protein [Massilia phyllostachyos]MCD2518352.1 glutaredoxin family protein [Massilia phyllostachyos]
MSVVPFTLYSRSYCHLCEDMRLALLALQRPGERFEVRVIDVDADPQLVARFDELVPVLFGDPAGPELCHYFLDPAAARGWADACSAVTA